jgi:hypothetical protein
VLGDAAKAISILRRRMPQMGRQGNQPWNKSSMRRMAIAWTDLAEQAEPNQRSDVVYETPEHERYQG